MKKFITACLIVVALIAFTTTPTMAEPITLTVMAITGLTVVASLATADTAYHAVKDSHNENGSATSSTKMMAVLRRKTTQIAQQLVKKEAIDRLAGC